MSGKYWIKLYKEIIDDPKMGMLTDRQYRRTIEMFCLADDDGYLPSVKDMTWKLRVKFEELETDLADLASVGILQKSDDRWLVTNYSKRQMAVSSTERWRQWRDRQQKEEYYGENKDEQQISNENQTNRLRELELESELNKDINTNNSPPYEMILQTWKELFPDKPQPRIDTKSVKDKIRIRWKSKDFQESWQTAMDRAASSPTLHNESWFDFRFFIRNDENYQKCIDRWMDWKDNQQNGQPKKKLPDGI